MVRFWSRFIAIINDMMNLKTVNDQKNELEIKLDQFKQIGNRLCIIAIVFACIYLLAFLFYGSLHRTHTIFIRAMNVTYLIIWNYFVPFFIHTTQWIIIYNTHVAKNTNIEENNSVNALYNNSIPTSKIQYSDFHDGFSFKFKKTYNFSNHAASDLIKNDQSQINGRHSVNSLSDITTLTANSFHGYNNSSGSNIKNDLVTEIH
ncbi:22280_t:CDS:2 [Cetraspora pellucida]|uniref:22280_t:CDS:1 n=1 Tax=Cetraspora pellucida TaxID=1433469 RepID=A0A9N8ZSF2_9GLOM|nr:22280_t:CDS:2 [Cetraspora pellucida]